MLAKYMNGHHTGGGIMKREAKVLIVDDSRSEVAVMEKMLKKQGVLDITTAENGLKAVELFEGALRNRSPYALVLLDILMPVMDGQEALKRMRALEKEAGMTKDDKATIIMVTSLHSPSDMINALFYGDCSDFLVKPFDFEDLWGMLAKYDFYNKTLGPEAFAWRKGMA
jgi:two-component system chemotaxis response regulator CheY